MNDSKPTNNLSASNSDNAKVIGFAIQYESSTKLRIQYNPNNALFIAAFILVLGFITVLAYNREKIYFVFYAVIFLQDLNNLRPIRCVIDKETGQFHYTRGSILGINYNNQDISGGITDILQVEMKRHASRWKDKFQIILLLKNHKRLILSDRALDFEDCQKFTEKIRDFIGSEIRIKAID